MFLCILFKDFINLNTFVLLYTDLSVANQVIQIPRHLIVKQQTALFQCFHKIQFHEIILWYKQSEKDMTLLGYLNLDKAYPEDKFKNKITFQGDGRNNASMSIVKPAPDDTAVYFCAAKQHSVTDSLVAVQKPLLSCQVI